MIVQTTDIEPLIIEEGPPNPKPKNFDKIVFVLGLVGGLFIIIGLGVGLTVRHVTEENTAPKMTFSRPRKVSRKRQLT